MDQRSTVISFRCDVGICWIFCIVLTDSPVVHWCENKLKRSNQSLGRFHLVSNRWVKLLSAVREKVHVFSWSLFVYFNISWRNSACSLRVIFSLWTNQMLDVETPATNITHCNRVAGIYTVSQKKQDTKLLHITSPNVNRFSKFFHW